ncbi:hypothetical protein CVT25_010495 [Psilocybe cyanescens]|uniref:Uncharacterized protein n=1 Tax=Psilocybe cyanescens TaxID=93625 RepID=A0A409XD90_PSICY|nr:hypothetical protein CVT25_010495 [Psilocybe cyanescens]
MKTDIPMMKKTCLIMDDIFSEEDEFDSEDEEVGEEELDELTKEVALNHFNAALFEAQQMAVKAKQEAMGQKPKQQELS